MYSFTLNKNAYKIPAVARELTLGQFVDIYPLQLDDQLGLMTALMGETPQVNIQDAKELRQMERELNNIYKLIHLLRTDLQETVNSGVLLLPPKKIEILGLTITVKDNMLNGLPYWAYEHTKQVILKRAQLGKDENFDATQEIPGILAHCFYCLVMNWRKKDDRIRADIPHVPYNEAKAEEFIEVIRECNFIEAMQWGNFFLIQQRNLWTSRRKRWRMRVKLWNLRLASKFSISMARPIPSKPLPEEIY